MAVSLKHRGAYSEIRAIVYLLDEGYEVFRNISQHGDTDLIIKDPDGNVRFIDVTSGSYYTKKDGTINVQACKQDMVGGKVDILVVMPDGKIIWKRNPKSKMGRE